MLYHQLLNQFISDLLFKKIHLVHQEFHESVAAILLSYEAIILHNLHFYSHRYILKDTELDLRVLMHFIIAFNMLFKSEIFWQGNFLSEFLR